MISRFTLLLLSIISIFLFGCHKQQNNMPAENSTDSGYPVFIHNYDSARNKKTLVFYHKPQRVIAYHQNNIEILDRLNETDKIVGALGRFVTVTKEEQFYQAELLKRLPYYGLYGINKETAVFLQPDFILGWPSSFAKSGVWSLGDTYFWQKRNVNCYMALQQKEKLLSETIEGECRYILDIGAVFNKTELTENIVKEINNFIELTLKKNPRKIKERVMILDFYGNTISAYGSNRLAGDMVRRLGAEIVPTGNRIGKEDILKANPDVVFLIYKTNDEIKIKEKFLQAKEFRSIKAVKRKRVYLLPLTYVYNSGLRVMDGLTVIANGLYPTS